MKTDREKTIHVRHMGNVGNRMFQFMFSKRLQSLVPGSRVVGYDIPGWPIKNVFPYSPSAETLSVDGYHEVDLFHIASLLNRGIFSHVSVKVFAQRFEYLPKVDIARSWFALPTGSVSGQTLQNKICNSEILINIRSAEILTGLHKDYMPLPISYYEQLVDQTGLAPVFMGQIDEGIYGEHLRTRFPQARFVKNRSPVDDFCMILGAKHVACSVSSFSWLAAWMSETAETVHLPLAGIFNPIQRPDIDLLPIGDHRYRYNRFPQLKWDASPAQLEHVINGEYKMSSFFEDELKQILKITAQRRCSIK